MLLEVGWVDGGLNDLQEARIFSASIILWDYNEVIYGAFLRLSLCHSLMCDYLPTLGQSVSQRTTTIHKRKETHAAVMEPYLLTACS